MIPSSLHQYPAQIKERENDLRARISVEQRRRLGYLLSILTPFALERLVSLAQRLLIEQEELTQGINGKVALRILFLVHNG